MEYRAPDMFQEAENTPSAGITTAPRLKTQPHTRLARVGAKEG
jgi:hypothetical protein